MDTGNRWCLLTAYDNGFSEIAKLSVPAMRRYAEMYGMEFREVLDKSYGRPPAWSKLYLTKECFDEGFDYVFWIDADAVIRRFDEDIRRVVRHDADFYFVRERHPIIGTPSKWRLNTGVYVMRNCDKSRRLIDEAIERDEFTNHMWWDQAAISAVFGFWSVFWRTEEHKPDEPTELSRHIGWLPSKWNASPLYDPEPDAIIHHFYGLRGGGKKAAMEIDAVIGKLASPSQDRAAALQQILKILEPALLAGLPLNEPRVSVPPVVLCDHDVRAGIKELRKRPWRLWTSKSWVKRKFLADVNR